MQRTQPLDLGAVFKQGGEVLYSEIDILPHYSQEHWYKVGFSQSGSGPLGIPLIEFEINEGQFELAVFHTSDPHALVDCHEGSQASRDVFRYQDACVYCEDTTPPSATCNAPSPWPEEILIRVTRNGTPQLTPCARYQLKISR